jgi:chemotaxis protein CheD
MVDKPENIIIGVSDAKISADPNSVLVTHALGSCIGVTRYDPVRKIGGLLHFQMPQSDKATGIENPFKYADTGFELLLDKLLSMKADKRKLIVKIAGGAKRLESKAGAFEIGKNNCLAIRKVLWKKGLLIRGQDIGGTIPRTMYFDLSDGTVTIKSARKIVKVM